MKLTTLLIITVVLATSFTYSQTIKTRECNSKKVEEIIDLNSITKCDIKEVQNKSGKKETQLKISYRKIRKRNINKSKLKKAVPKKAQLKVFTIKLNNKT